MSKHTSDGSEDFYVQSELGLTDKKGLVANMWLPDSRSDLESRPVCHCIANISLNMILNHNNQKEASWFLFTVC